MMAVLGYWLAWLMHGRTISSRPEYGATSSDDGQTGAESFQMIQEMENGH
jgi:hypothetical protein